MEISTVVECVLPDNHGVLREQDVLILIVLLVFEQFLHYFSPCQTCSRSCLVIPFEEGLRITNCRLLCLLLHQVIEHGRLVEHSKFLLTSHLFFLLEQLLCQLVLIVSDCHIERLLRHLTEFTVADHVVLGRALAYSRVVSVGQPGAAMAHC